jgi:hypothetical protein
MRRIKTFINVKNLLIGLLVALLVINSSPVQTGILQRFTQSINSHVGKSIFVITDIAHASGMAGYLCMVS